MEIQNCPVANQLTDYQPLVSILLPNLNYKKFLVDRFESILLQTYETWELIVIDSYSDDGAWELIQEYAKRDDRITISQAPREGIYAGLNKCLEKANGEFIYIATSDDTMDPRCLEIMVTELQENPDCDICHCCLNVIDETGQPLPPGKNWRSFPMAAYFGKQLDKAHIRRSPHDGILHAAVFTVYTSLTQILVRNVVFHKVGNFKTNIGEAADFEWAMRASMIFNTVHVPLELATWRTHDEQATANAPNPIGSENNYASMVSMVKSAHADLKELNPLLHARLSINRIKFLYERNQIECGTWERSGILSKLVYLVKMLRVNPVAVISFLTDTYMLKREFDEIQYIKKLLADYDCEDSLEQIETHFDYEVSRHR